MKQSYKKYGEDDLKVFQFPRPCTKKSLLLKAIVVVASALVVSGIFNRVNQI